jgi:hypothetical protein
MKLELESHLRRECSTGGRVQLRRGSHDVGVSVGGSAGVGRAFDGEVGFDRLGRMAFDPLDGFHAGQSNLRSLNQDSLMELPEMKRKLNV